MGKEEIKALSEILSSKTKFRRVLYIIAMVLLTILIIAGIGFYFGAITWEIGK